MTQPRLGVDVGGTFTDLVLWDPAQDVLKVVKVPSTPSDPSRAVLAGVERLASEGLIPADLGAFIHGTTVPTNAVLEERGAKTGLLVTRGFTAVYEVMDQTRGFGPAAYNIEFERPRLLVSRRLTVEVEERISARGEILTPLDETQARHAIARFREAGVEAVAVCLLFSFLNPIHELRLREILQEELPGCHISLSCHVLPQIREYYRMSTTVLNAYVGVVLRAYLGALEAALRERGVGTRSLFLMQSNGGVTTFQGAAVRGAQCLLSGPAAGAIAAASLGKTLSERRLISFDMGGTSTDVALIEEGRAVTTTEMKIAGRHVALPMIEINTVGAGGGTIAWVDEVGDLHLGPRSAGADPGPCCYGRGGVEPTVTDANVALGTIDPAYFLGGALRLNRDLALRGIAEKVGKPLGLGPLEAAAGILRIVNTLIAEAIRAVSTERGFDLREFCLLPFGGAGPLHAAALAEDLNIGKIIVPSHPGLTSAQGLLMTDVRHDYVTSRLVPLQEMPAEGFNRILDALHEQARADLRREGLEKHRHWFESSLDMRYEGQGYELSVPLDEGRVLPDTIAGLRFRFDEIHERTYGHRASSQAVELVSVRLKAFAQVEKWELKKVPFAHNAGEEKRKGTREIVLPERKKPFLCPAFERSHLRPGSVVPGPAVFDQPDTTILILPGWTATIDDYGNVVMERRA